MRKLVIVGSGGFAREVEWLVERINKVNLTWEFLGFIDNGAKTGKVAGGDDFVLKYLQENITENINNSLNIEEKISSVIDEKLDKIQKDISIGNCNIINLACTIGHDAVLEDFVTVNPGVNISGNTIIGAGCNIGTGTQVVQGLRVGKNTLVGAGAVVTGDLPDDCTAVGVPAKVIKIRGNRV